jgi:plasmid stabilization system protein ParE
LELTVYWTRIAENKLNDIYNYHEIEASTNVAQGLVQGIIDRTINLEKNPFIGQEEELLANRTQRFRYLIYKNYKIIYWVNTNKNRIEIANVFNTKQNPDKITEIR